jgi:hypothetical protein
MKKFIILLCFVISFVLEAEQIPHLILHFDVNKTLIASDKTENKSVEDVINELLSKKHSAYWDETQREPLTFEAYVNRILLPGDEHNIQLKFERLAYLIHFIDYLRERQHPLYSTVVEEFNLVLETMKKGQGNVFPSFYHLISELNQRGLSYTIFLRSFGKEVFEIEHEINSVANQLFTIDGVFQAGILHLNGREALSGAAAIYQFFSSKEHGVIRDDWSYWVKGKMEASYGKPFYIDQEDKTILTLFFDDNVKRNSNEKNIVAPLDSKTGEFLSITQLIQSKQIIPVNTLEAILNERYFIEHVEGALQIYRDHHARACLKNI